MKVVVAIVLALAALSLAACVNNSNLCPSGFEYSSQYDACLADDAGSSASSADAGAAPAETTPSEGGSTSEAAADDASSGLGSTCNSDPDCTGAAAYCLKSPTAPTAPGACTFTSCTPAECTSAYACCDCAHASLPSLQSYPPNTCIKAASEAQAVALGCTCL